VREVPSRHNDACAALDCAAEFLFARGTPLALCHVVSASHVQEEVMNAIKASVVLAVGFLGIFAGSARAQEIIVVKVPFSFVVHGKEMPAGRYEVTSDAGVLTVRGTDNNASSFALTMPADGRDPVSNEPSLVFVKHENQNMLSQIWESPTEGLAIPGSPVVSKHDRAEIQSPSPIVLTAEHDLGK
jgi:hypothetical protein